MTHAASAEHRSSSEQHAIRQVESRLVEQFPELSADDIDRAVRTQYVRFDKSPIRDFVAVLVERATRQQLAGDRDKRQPAATRDVSVE